MGAPIEGGMGDPEFKPLADPRGVLADQYGVRMWPTTVAIDAGGRIAAIQMGADPDALDSLERES